MAIVVVKIVDSNCQDADVPLNCPHCGSCDIRRWGWTSRQIRDVKPMNAIIYRIYCNHCHTSSRYYPKGIDHSHYTERVRRLASLCWLLGLSVRDVIRVFGELDVELNRMVVWREGQKLVNELNSKKLLNPNMRFEIDKSGNVNNRPTGNVLLVFSLMNGKTAILGSLDTQDPISVISWIKPILKEMDIQIETMGTREFF